MQGITRTVEWIAGLSFLAGAVNVMAPDHWMPASLVAWQRGWRRGRSVGMAIALLVGHVLLGAMIYFAADRVLLSLGSIDRLVFYGVLAAVSILLIRFFRFSTRFSTISDSFRSGPSSVSGILVVVSLLGPCEAIIPILIKAHLLGIGYLIPVTAFLAGTLLAGISLVMMGRGLWSRPFYLPRGLHWVRGRSALVPALIVLTAAISLIFRVR